MKPGNRCITSSVDPLPGCGWPGTARLGAVLILTALLAVSAATAAQNTTPHPAGGPALPRAQQRVFRAALQTVAPSIVKIETIGGALPAERQQDQSGRVRAAPAFRQADGPTTGLIWSADGYIVTSSFNFLRDPSIITVTLHDRRRFVARLVARDRAARLALLKIDATDLPVPQVLTREQLRPGQWALAAGYGHGGQSPAVALGIVAALDRMSATAVQTDAKISPANYGGPLFDIAGRVIGVCVPLGPGDEEVAGVEWYDSGIGFAIHVDHIRRRLPRLESGQDLERGLLGVMLDVRSPVVGESDEHAGLRILRPPRGPAAAAGLKAEDVITHVDGRPTPRLVEFRRAVALKAAGDDIVVTYRRGDQVGKVTVRLARAADFRLPAASQPK